MTFEGGETTKMDVSTMNSAVQNLVNYKAERKRLLAAVRAAKSLGLAYSELEAQAAEMLGVVERQKLRVRRLQREAGEHVAEREFLNGNPSSYAQWRKGNILGDAYEISDDGFVRNAETGRLVTRGIRYNRGVVHVMNRQGKPSTYMLDKLVADAWLGRPVKKMITHADKNKLNCRKENLEC